MQHLAAITTLLPLLLLLLPPLLLLTDASIGLCRPEDY
jgi:hypothetical protein